MKTITTSNMSNQETRKLKKIAPRPELSGILAESEKNSNRSQGSSPTSRSRIANGSRNAQSGQLGTPDSAPSKSNKPSATGGANSALTVRNVPDHMRYAIRRQQNNERAKKCRAERRIAEKEMQTQVKNNAHRIKNLESQVEGLEARLAEKRNARKQATRKGKPSVQNPGEFFETEKFFGDPF